MARTLPIHSSQVSRMIGIVTYNLQRTFQSTMTTTTTTMTTMTTTTTAVTTRGFLEKSECLKFIFLFQAQDFCNPNSRSFGAETFGWYDFWPISNLPTWMFSRKLVHWPGLGGLISFKSPLNISRMGEYKWGLLAISVSLMFTKKW